MSLTVENPPIYPYELEFELRVIAFNVKIYIKSRGLTPFSFRLDGCCLILAVVEKRKITERN